MKRNILGRVLVIPAAFILTMPLMADTVYTYTGNDFTEASSPFSTSDSITGEFTVATALLPDTIYDGLTPLSFSFTDDVNTATTSDLNGLPTFDVTTGSTGNILSWYIVYDLLPAYATISTESDSGGVTDLVYGSPSGDAFNDNDAGSWAVSTTSTVPEPGNLMLVGLGLAAIGVVRHRLQRRGTLRERRT
jgi:hypothetical protein